MNTKIVLKKSAFLQMINVGQETIVYHSLFGNPRIINGEGMELINFFDKSATIPALLNTQVFENQEEEIANLMTSYFLIPTELKERNLLKKKTMEIVKLFLTFFSYCERMGVSIARY